MRISLPFRVFVLSMGVWGTMAVVGAELADPTRPLGYMTPGKAVESDLTLTSVLITRSSRSAVINGKRVVEGQKIGDTEVVSIHPGGVILGRGNLSRELKVHQDDVKHFAD